MAISYKKIPIYGTASSFADLLELQKFATILHEADINVKPIDDRLTQLAKYEINVKAKSPIAIGDDTIIELFGKGWL